MATAQPHRSMRLKRFKSSQHRPSRQLVAGKAAQALGDISAAAAFFRKAAELDESWEAPHYFLAHLYQKMPGKSRWRRLKS